jgi:hypothetical protein
MAQIGWKCSWHRETRNYCSIVVENIFKKDQFGDLTVKKKIILQFILPVNAVFEDVNWIQFHQN